MEMEMKMKDNGQRVSTGNTFTPERIVTYDAKEAKRRNNTGVLMDVARQFVDQFPGTEEYIRVFACPRCRFAELAIVPFVINELDTTALEYRCSKHGGILGHSFVHPSGGAWVEANDKMPELCGILAEFEGMIDAAADAVDATEEIRSTIKAIWSGENRRFAVTPQKIHDTLLPLFKAWDYKSLFAFEREFNAFFALIENGKIPSPADPEKMLPALNAELMNMAARRFIDSEGEDTKSCISWKVNREVAHRIRVIREVIYEYTMPYHYQLARPEWARFWHFSPKNGPNGNMSTLPQRKQRDEDEQYTYVPPELDDDERAAGIGTFDQMYPAFKPKPKGRWETA